MAVFQVKIDGKPIAVFCPADGNTNLFKHAPRLVTCNKCGHTFETPAEVTLLVEQVVMVSEN